MGAFSVCAPDVPLIKGSHSCSPACLCKVCERRKFPLRPHPSHVCNVSHTHTQTSVHAMSPKPLILGNTLPLHTIRMYVITHRLFLQRKQPPSVSEPPFPQATLPYFTLPSKTQPCGQRDKDAVLTLKKTTVVLFLLVLFTDCKIISSRSIKVLTLDA